MICVPAPSLAFHCSTYCTPFQWNMHLCNIYNSCLFLKWEIYKHLWCSREMYMKLNVLILRKPQVTSDLQICAGAEGWEDRGRTLLSSSIFYFLSQRFRRALTLEFKRRSQGYYINNTWRPSSPHRECLMQCSQFLTCCNAQDVHTNVSNSNHAALSLCLAFLFLSLLRLFIEATVNPRWINLVSCLG